MNLLRYLPTASLSPFILRYQIVECAEDRVNRILPSTAPVLAFRFRGKVNQITGNHHEELPASMISGLRKSGRLIHYMESSGNILVIFRDGHAASFIREPLYELFGESVNIGQLKGFRDIEDLESQLHEVQRHEERIDLVEKYLLSKLYNRKSDQLMLAAVSRVWSSKGTLRVKELADELCISQDAFEKRFRKAVGLSPKQFSYLVRMRLVIDGGRTNSLTSVALNAGYFDQSHFNKDFKLFTGQTPGDYFKMPVEW